MALPRRDIPGRSRAMVILGLLALASFLILWIRQLEDDIARPRLQVAVNPRYEVTLADRWSPLEEPLDFARVRPPHPIKIGSGQTLGGLLTDLGLSAAESRSAIAATKKYVDVRKIRAGEAGEVFFGPDRQLAGFDLRIPDKGWVMVRRQTEQWTSEFRELKRRVMVRGIEGELTDALESAVRRAGGLAQVTYRMADVLQWDLDFNRDLRTGDRFSVLYEEVEIEGETARAGDIMALVYQNRGKRFEAFRFEDAYYDSSGRPLQKMFLRSPLPFSRVTSRFSRRRFHPVLKIHRPHYGVDYGAPRGTPVRATANGVVDFVGTSGGAGKMVRLRHTNDYQTSYLHLSGFRSGVRRGRRVSQGEVIGYVGSTGLATGPHLDYRVKKSGRWIDPLSLSQTPAEPVAPRDLPRFRAHRDALQAALEGGVLRLPETHRLARRDSESFELSTGDVSSPAAAR